MKKILIAVLLAVSMCGCSLAKTVVDSVTESVNVDEILKAQEITINSAASSAAETITDAQQIGDFITALEMDSWKIVSLPENAERSGEFSFAQNETIKLGQDESDVQLEDVCKIYTYKDLPYITFEVAGIGVDFEIPQSAADYLSSYIN